MAERNATVAEARPFLPDKGLHTSNCIDYNSICLAFLALLGFAFGRNDCLLRSHWASKVSRHSLLDNSGVLDVIVDGEGHTRRNWLSTLGPTLVRDEDVEPPRDKQTNEEGEDNDMR